MHVNVDGVVVEGTLSGTWKNKVQHSHMVQYMLRISLEKERIIKAHAKATVRQVF